MVWSADGELRLACWEQWGWGLQALGVDMAQNKWEPFVPPAWSQPCSEMARHPDLARAMEPCLLAVALCLPHMASCSRPPTALTFPAKWASLLAPRFVLCLRASF